MRAFLILALLLPIGTAATAQPKVFPKRNPVATEYGSAGGDVPIGLRLEEAITEADMRPLGTEMNPVKADRPDGERAYIARLRCGDGSAPEAGERSMVGAGPFGTPMTAYPLKCKDGKSFQLHFDMYFSYVENQAPAGFTIQP